jgi:hypothetical protein
MVWLLQAWLRFTYVIAVLVTKLRMHPPQLVERGIMFDGRSPPAEGMARDWPHGRGCYISADEELRVRASAQRLCLEKL